MRTLFTSNSTLLNRNFVHPPHPPLRIFLLLLLLAVCGRSANGQGLLSYETYAISMKSYLNKAWTVERTEYINIQKGKNWNLVPNVGIVFGLPSVNLNTSAIATYKQRQAETAAKLKSIDLKYELLLNESLNNLRIEMEKAKNENERLTSFQNQLATREMIYQIHKEAYSKKEMKPIDYLREKLLYETFKSEIENKNRDYVVMIKNVEKLAHYDMPQEVIYYAGSDELEGSSNHMLITPDRLSGAPAAQPTPAAEPMKNALGGW